MTTISRWLAPVRQLAAAFFRHELTLRRERGQMHVVLAERPKPVPGAPKADHSEAAGHARPRRGGNSSRDRSHEAERRRRHEELMLVRTELAALLNELPETRSTMRHLVFVEKAIENKGLKVLHKVPLDVMRRAHEQLENLVTNWSPAGLANLRSKMAVAIIDREHTDPDAEADAYRTAAVLDAGRREELEQPPTVALRSDEEALAAAYAALGDMAPAPATTIEMQGELGSASARALRLPPSRLPVSDSVEIDVRVLQS
jgi:hypothetical protein